MRIGMTPMFVNEALPRVMRALRDVDAEANFQISCLRSFDLVQRFTNGHLDIAVLPLPSGLPEACRAEWQSRLVWLGSPRPMVSPGTPIPLIGWPGSVSYNVAIEAMNRNSQPYALNFLAEDWNAVIAAVREGLGYVAVPERAVPADCKPAREYFLPALPTLTSGIFVRDEAADEQIDDMVVALERVLSGPLPPRDVTGQLARA